MADFATEVPSVWPGLEDAQAALEFLHGDGFGPLELRPIKPRGKVKAVPRHFRTPEALLEFVSKLDGEFETLAVNLNDLDPKAVDALEPGKAARDDCIGTLMNILVDADPVRPSGACATDEERAKAREVLLEVRAVLSSLGLPDPLVASSGNGFHLIYAIDLPPSDAGLVAAFLKALSDRFSTDAVKIDSKVGNPGRVVRLYGTLTCKGEGSERRPHRRSKVLEVPKERVAVPRHLIEEVAAWFPVDEQLQPSGETSGRRLDVEEYLRRHGISWARSGEWRDNGQRWVLEVCPFNDEHRDMAAYVVQLANGAIAAGCHHNGCEGKNWHDLRRKFEPGWEPAAPRAAEKRLPDGTVVQFALTETGLAERYAVRYADEVRWVSDGGRFYIWCGTHWVADTDGGMAMGLSKELVRSIPGEFRKGDDPKRQAALVTFAIESESRFKRESLIKLAKAEENLRLLVKDLDRDPYLLTTPNGTIDLRDSSLHPHRQDDYITKASATCYRPEAECPTWLAFLERIQPDEAVRGYLQRLFGYFLTGDTGEQKLWIFFGDGSNGKTTLVETFFEVLGRDHAIQAEPDLLIESKAPKQAGARADLLGVRVAACSEIGEDRRLDEPLAKTLTGGDRIRARWLYENAFEFKPSHKLVIVANHLPVVRGGDEGIWRRLEVVPFDVLVPEDERDKDLAQKLLGEREGILAWAVRGYEQYRELGQLDPPELIRAATRQYRDRSDSVAQFLEACCKQQPGDVSDASDLRRAYETFCDQEGLPRVPGTTFSRRLQALGFQRTKVGRYRYRGLRLVRRGRGADENAREAA